MRDAYVLLHELKQSLKRSILQLEVGSIHSRSSISRDSRDLEVTAQKKESC